MNKIVLLSGNPNVGKSSIFNLLTGSHQHTGNWTGKTVETQIGYLKPDKDVTLVDLPGTYSLNCMSDEEIVARDAILFDKPNKNVVVIDSCFLERNLNLLLQIMELDNNVIVCLNLCDEANKKHISINEKKLINILNVPVVRTSAKTKDGINELIKLIKNDDVYSGNKLMYSKDIENKINELSSLINVDNINKRFIAIKMLEGDKTIIKSIEEKFNINILTEAVNEFFRVNDTEKIKDEIIKTITDRCAYIASEVIDKNNSDITSGTRRIDKVLTSKVFGLPIFLVLLMLIFYITIVFANYPSQMLSNFFNYIEELILKFCVNMNISGFIYEPLIFGVFRTLGWVVSVMLPPMMIFFPIFGILEECGFLPRIAFNFDRIFQKACAHGKQALTMCMGFGCNAVGVIGSRIIDSPRDKLVAIITNSFVPCNGRFPMMISLITIFFVSTSGIGNGIISSLILCLLILFSIVVSLIVSKILSFTILKGISSHFILELPLYRKPNVISVIVRNILDKALFVLLRAVKVAVPAGLIIWIFANINISGESILVIISNFLDPLANLIGLDGFILLAFFLAFPANEIVLPIILMCYLSTNSMIEINDAVALKELLVANGWTYMTAINVCLFSLMHFPCATTFLTIKKEVGMKWALVSVIIPLITGFIILFIINTIIL